MKEIGDKSSLLPQEYFYEGIWPFVFLPNGPPHPCHDYYFFFFFWGGGVDDYYYFYDQIPS